MGFVWQDIYPGQRYRVIAKTPLSFLEVGDMLIVDEEEEDGKYNWHLNEVEEGQAYGFISPVDNFDSPWYERIE